MNDTEAVPQFDEVKRRLRPGDVFQATDHTWSRNGPKDSRWRGTCPFCDCDNERVFSVEADSLLWHCHHCERDGGLLDYVAELEGIGSGARGSLEGKEFLRAWEALARHAGCEGPPELNTEEGSGLKKRDRRPRKSRDRTRSEQLATASGGNMSRDIPPRGQREKPILDTLESELRTALSRYRNALKESDKAQSYVEGRGLSVGTLYHHGCGFAPAGEWVGSDNAPRLVTPHTTPLGRSSDGQRLRLVNLSGRYLGECSDGKRHRHIGGNPTALFNASAIGGDSFDPAEPLVICEGPLDALSFIEAGWNRAVALHNTDGVPWEALRESAETLVFAFDRDDTGREDAMERACEAAIRGGFDPYTLHDEDTYAGHNDPNDALQAGDLSLGYLRDLKSGDAKREGAAEEDNPMHSADSGEPDGARETAANGSDPEADRCPTPQERTDTATEETPTAATPDGGRDGEQATDLIPYWNGDNIGYLGRWLWERGGVPDGDVGAGLYADRELHKWIKEKLEAGPNGTSEETQIRLRWVLWRLYAAHGPEEVPACFIPDRPDKDDTGGNTRPKTADMWEERPRDPYRLGRLPEDVETKRTAAPKDNPHPGKRGIEIDSPYSEDFVRDLKVLPEWARTWNGEAWVVDDVFGRYVGDACWEYFG